MKRSAFFLAFWVFAQVARVHAPPVCAQDLPPLDEKSPQVLSTPAISEHDVELFGKMAQLWRLADETEAIQYYGDFSLHMGPRRLSAQDAVIWMRKAEHEGRSYLQFEVFLWRAARVVEPGGSVTTGSALFVTLQTFGTLSVNYDATSTEPGDSSALYRQASHVRRELSPFQTPLYAKDSPVEVTRPTDDTQSQVLRANRPVMIRPGKSMVSMFEGGQRLLVASGGVYLAQGTGRSEDFLEIRAQNAVLYAKESALQDRLREGLDEDDAISDDELEKALAEDDERVFQDMMSTAGEGELGEVSGFLSGAYLEGDVVLSRGDRRIRASRLYYDFDNDRALILDAVMSAMIPERNLPLYVRAEQVRQLSSREYLARKAVLSTSEFHTPLYAIGADKVYLYDRTLGPPGGQVSGLIAGTYKAYHTTLRMDGVPVSYWPYARGDFKQSESLLKGATAGYSDDFGATLETKWYLSSLLGLEPVDGVDSTLLLDYFSERGPAVGANVDYKLDNSFGLFRGYYISDHGDDELGGFRDDIEPPHQSRGRALWRHRQILPKGWELSLEMSYISDADFLESYFESEFDEDKEQETLIYLKKQEDNWAVTALAQWRILDWLEQTEHLPDVGFHWIGQPLGEWGSYFQESRVGAVRFRLDKRLLFESDRFDNRSRSDVTARADSRHEVDFPFSLGPVKVVPYGVVRGTAYDGNLPTQQGYKGRVFLQGGVRSSMYFSRTYPDVQSRLWDLNGLRHIIKPDVTAWVAHSNEDSRDLTPFDEGVDDYDDFNGVSVGVRQRLQTKRGPADAQRVVDWMLFDVEVGFFDGDNQSAEFTRGRALSFRPEDSITANYLYANYAWRISDTTAFLSDVNVDLNDTSVGSLNASLAVERSPRFSYFVGYRYIGEIDSNLIGAGFNYRINRKHTLAVRDYWDLDLGRNAGLEIAYIRKFPRWYVGVTFEIDDAKDRTGISLSAWPEGLPAAAIGSRAYTGVTESAAITEE